MSYLDIARQVKEEDGIEKNPHTLIDQTIRDINKEWKPEALEWIKVNRPDEWGKILAIENEINRMALAGDIDGLRKALEAYKKLFSGVVLGEGQGNLFDQRR